MGKSTHDVLKTAGDAPVRLFKQFLPEIKAVEGDGNRFRFTITTDGVDRDKDVIAAGGWKLDSYLRNPVVLWAHTYDKPPIALARSIEQTPTGLVSEADFVDAATYPFAGMIASLVRLGVLRATSVGFRPLKWNFNETRGGVDFEEQELLEYSIVPVPANAECLIAAADAGIDVEPLREWAEQTLERVGRSQAYWLSASGGIVRQFFFSGAPSTGVACSHRRRAAAEGMAGAMDQCMGDMEKCMGEMDAAKDSMTSARDRMQQMRDDMPKDVGGSRKAADDGCPMDMPDCPMYDERVAAAPATKGVPSGDASAATPPETKETKVPDADDVIDLDAIEADECDGITTEDVMAAVREVVATETRTSVDRALNVARGRID